MCVLPFGSGAKRRVRRVGVVGWEVIGLVVGVGGTVVVSDTLSTDRQGMGTYTYTNTIIYNMQ